MTKVSEVAVIGCGVIGLTTAMEIQKKLSNAVQVTIFAETFSPYTTSDVAAGLWTPFCLYENSEEDIFRWSKITYDFIIKYWREGKAKEAGITLLHAIFLSTDKNYVIPKWLEVTLGYESLTQNLLEKLKKQYEQEFTAGFSYVAPTWEASIFLPYFQKEFIKNGGKVVSKRIHNYKELIEYDVVVNCTGLGALTLSQDVNMYAVRGQVLRVNASWIYTSLCFTIDENYSCYVIPNINSVVVGGTTQKKNYNKDISQTDKQVILNNVAKVIPSFNNSHIIKEIVGFRPGRNKIRLGEEFVECEGKTLNIVHNYGHGGAGITLAVGCAKDAAEIVKKIISIKKSRL